MLFVIPGMSALTIFDIDVEIFRSTPINASTGIWMRIRIAKFVLNATAITRDKYNFTIRVMERTDNIF